MSLNSRPRGNRCVGMCFARLFFRTDFPHGHHEVNTKHIMVERSMVQPIQDNMNTRLYSAKRLSVLSACVAVTLMVIASCAAHAQNGAAIPTQGSAAVDMNRSAARMPIRTAAQVIRRVFDELVAAIHDPARPPRLEVVTDSSMSIACYDPGERVIRVDVRLYQLFRLFGKDSLNALASVLGHELAHCYKGFSAARGRKSIDYMSRMAAIVQHRDISEETQADLFSGFYGRIAGYDVVRVTPSVLESVYEAYKIPPGANGDYLSLADRKSVAVRAGDRLRSLFPVFDAANFLTLARQYPEAQRCYDHVIREFPGRELFNNAGVAYVQQVLNIIDFDDVGVVYPLEMDADSRLRGTDVMNGRVDRSTRSPNGEDSALVRRLLDSAEARFHAARERDGAYAPALINLATVYILKHEYHKAIDTAAAAMRIDTSRMTRILGVTVQSIAQFRMALPTNALTHLLSVRDAARGTDAADLVDANLAVLEKKDFRIPSGLGIGSPGEMIGGLRAGDTAAFRPADRTEQIGGEVPLRVLTKKLPDCTLYRVEKDSSWAQFIWAADDYDGESKRGVRIGTSTGGDVKRLYGDKPRIVNARQGQFWIYDYSKLIFLISPEGRVVKWAVWAVG